MFMLTLLIIYIVFDIRSVLLCPSETESSAVWWTTQRVGRHLLPRSGFFFQGFQYALMPPTNNNTEIHLCLQLFLLELREENGFCQRTASGRPDLSRFLRERENETERGNVSVVSSPFLLKTIL